MESVVKGVRSGKEGSEREGIGIKLRELYVGD